MIKNNLGKLNIKVSRLGFGTLRLPLLSNKKIDIKETERMLDYAYQNGINYFDTAHTYLGNKAQLVLCEILQKYPRSTYYIANKIPFGLCTSSNHAEIVFEKHLKLCNLDYFDFYLCHCLNHSEWEKIKRRQILSVLQKLRSEKKIRYLGFSFHGDYETFCNILDEIDWDFAQIQTNYLDEKFLNAELLYKELKNRDIPCIVMEPIKGGLLTNLPKKFQQKIYDRGETPARLALRWCLDQDHIHLILSGMSNMEQVIQNIELFNSPKKLDMNDYDLIDHIRKQLIMSEIIQCTGCEYCSKCPIKIPIPRIFDLYNEYCMFGEKILNEKKRSVLLHTINSCIQCGKCTFSCPQQINVPQQFSIIQKTIE